MNRREAIAALTALPATARLSVAQVAPTDVVIVEVDSALNAETAQRVHDHVKRVWPNRKVLVLDRSIRIRIAPE